MLSKHDVGSTELVRESGGQAMQLLAPSLGSALRPCSRPMRTTGETNSCSLYTARAAQAGEIGECLNCFFKVVKSWLGRVGSTKPEGRRPGRPAASSRRGLPEKP